MMLSALDTSLRTSIAHARKIIPQFKPHGTPQATHKVPPEVYSPLGRRVEYICSHRSGAQQQSD